MCQGLTKRGVPCRKHASCFCSVHHSQCAIPLYDMSEDWPTSCQIRSYAFKVDTYDDMISRVNRIKRLVRVENGGGSPYSVRMAFISLAELFKLNVKFVSDESFQKCIDTVATKLDAISELDVYTEDFRRKCLKRHREEARKRVYTFYFKRCEDLCDDVIEKVLECV